MSEPLYKAIHKRRLPEDVLALLIRLAAIPIPVAVSLPNNASKYLVGLNTTPLIVDNAVDQVLKVARIVSLDDAKQNLGDKADHLLNVYVDCDRETFEVTTTYVFNNRDTALMFKLSLQ